MTENLSNATVPTTDNSPAGTKGNGKTGRKHRSKEERLADLRAQIERLENAPDKAVVSSNPTYKRLSEIKAELAKRFRTVVQDRDGYFNTKSGAMVILPLVDRIANLRTRLREYQERLSQIDTLATVLPAKMAEVAALMERAAAGEDVAIPDGILLDENTPTAETAHVVAEAVAEGADIES